MAATALSGTSYFRNGTRKTVTDPSGSVTQYAYDGQNRLKTATTDATGSPRTTTYGYEPDGLLKTVSYPNGVVATHGYDKADRLLSIVNVRDATPISSYAYSGIHPTSGLLVSYDANGNRLIQVETNGGSTETTTYTYDDLDRLASVSYPIDTTYPNGRVVSYGYDAVGNRLRETERDLAATLLADKQGIFDNANRLTELTDLVAPANTTTFTWDANGNQLTKTTNGLTTENRYDLRDKLVEVERGGQTLARFLATSTSGGSSRSAIRRARVAAASRSTSTTSAGSFSTSRTASRRLATSGRTRSWCRCSRVAASGATSRSTGSIRCSR